MPKLLKMKVKSCGCGPECSCDTRKMVYMLVSIAALVVFAFAIHFFTLKSVERHLFNNPDIIINALQNKQRMESENIYKQQAEALKEMLPALASDPVSPVLGKADSEKMIIMFYDYNCGFCKQMHGRLAEMLKKHDDIKIVLKELPVLAPSSELAARASLAANMQKKFSQMHTALMTNKGEITDALITSIATKNGINVKKLKDDMKSQQVTDQIETNQAIANALGIQGIPTLIVGDQIISGGAEEQTILDALNKK